VRLLQAIEQPFLSTVREVLGDKYTAYLDRLYRRVIHFILGLLIVGFNQTCVTLERTRHTYDTNSAASTSSTAALVSSGRNSDSHCSDTTTTTTTNNNNNNNNNSTRRVKNCWTEEDQIRSSEV